MGWTRRPSPYITPEMPVRPDGPYGIAKAFGEATGRHFSDRYGLSVLCLRIGTLNPESRPTNPRQFATLLTHRDLAHLVERCIEAARRPSVRASSTAYPTTSGASGTYRTRES